MARINSYNLDLTITNQDLVLGSSYEGTFNGVARYTTRNYRLEDLAEFFAGYDFNAGLSLTTIEGQISDINYSISLANSATLALDDRLTTAEASIVSNASSISGLSSSISTNTSNISSVTSSVQSLSTSLSATQSTVSTINSNIANRTQWDEAYSWGDHRGQNYLTSVSINEEDPYFKSHAAHNVTAAKISNWDDAYQGAITGFDIQQNADGSQKTITLTRRDNTTLTSTASDIYGIPSGTFTDTNYYVVSGVLSSGGILRLTRQGISGTVDISGFDDRYALKSHTHTGYAASAHNHDGVYSPVGHTHVAADITDLSSWFSTYGFVPVTGGNFTGTVGFSTSTNPSISSTISSSTFALQAISAGIPTMGYSGLYLNSNNAFELILKDANGNSNVFLTADGTSTIGGNTIWHSGNLSTSNFLSTTGGTMTGLLNVNTSGTGISVNVPSNNWAVRASSLANAVNASGIWMSSSNNASLYLRDSSGTLQTQINSSTSSTFNYGIITNGTIVVGGNVDVAGDITVDGVTSFYSGIRPYVSGIGNANNIVSLIPANTFGSQLVSAGTNYASPNASSLSYGQVFVFRGADSDGNRDLYLWKSNGDNSDFHIGSTHSSNGAQWFKLWHSGNDGPGSLLDSDTLDGVQASQFLRSDTGDVATGNLTFAGQVYIDNSDTLPVLTFRDASTDRLLFTNSSNQLRFRYNGVNDGVVVHTAASADFGNNSLTAQNFILTSDARLKSDIDDIEYRGDVAWRQFKLGGNLRYGVIAQEVEEIYPELVYTDEKGYKSVSYIDILVSENAKLRDRVESLEKDIEIIKKMLTK